MVSPPAVGYEAPNWPPSSWQGLAKRRPVLFALLIILAMMLLKFPLVLPFTIAGYESTTDQVMDVGIALALASFVILPLETLLGQTLPLWLSQRATWPWRIAVATVVFAVLHIPAGPIGVGVGIAGGIPLAFACLCWRPLGFWRAFGYTTFAHAGHNAIAFGIYLATQGME